nr:MAG TPA: hypothetical protein [Caudoviricetes sp.]
MKEFSFSTSISRTFSVSKSLSFSLWDYKFNQLLVQRKFVTM